MRDILDAIFATHSIYAWSFYITLALVAIESAYGALLACVELFLAHLPPIRIVFRWPHRARK